MDKTYPLIKRIS